MIKEIGLWQSILSQYRWPTCAPDHIAASQSDGTAAEAARFASVPWACAAGRTALRVRTAPTAHPAPRESRSQENDTNPIRQLLTNAYQAAASELSKDFGRAPIVSAPSAVRFFCASANAVVTGHHFRK